MINWCNLKIDHKFFEKDRHLCLKINNRIMKHCELCGYLLLSSKYQVERHFTRQHPSSDIYFSQSNGFLIYGSLPRDIRYDNFVEYLADSTIKLNEADPLSIKKAGRPFLKKTQAQDQPPSHSSTSILFNQQDNEYQGSLLIKKRKLEQSVNNQSEQTINQQKSNQLAEEESQSCVGIDANEFTFAQDQQLKQQFNSTAKTDYQQQNKTTQSPKQQLLQGSNNNSEIILQQPRNRYAKLIQQRKSYYDQLLAKRKQYTLLKADNQMFFSKIQNLSARKVSLKEDLSKYKTKYTREKEAKQHYTEINAQLKQENEELRKENQTLKQQLKEAQAQMVETEAIQYWKDKQVELQNELQYQQQQLKKKEEAYDRLTDKYFEDDQKNKEIIQALEKKEDQQRHEIQRQEQHNKKNDEIIQDLNFQKIALEEQNQNYHNQLHEYYYMGHKICEFRCANCIKFSQHSGELRKKFDKITTKEKIQTKYMKMTEDIKELRKQLEYKTKLVDDKERIIKQQEQYYENEIEHKQKDCNIMYKNNQMSQWEQERLIKQNQELKSQLEDKEDDKQQRLENILQNLQSIQEKQIDSKKQQCYDKWSNFSLDSDQQIQQKNQDDDESENEYLNIDSNASEKRMLIQGNQSRDYANEQEKQNMELVNQKAIDQLKKVIDKLPQLKKIRALDVCCGGGHLTKYLLNDMFQEIDMIDQSINSIKIACQLQMSLEFKGEIQQSRMQDFVPDKMYNLIVMRYCIGYLKRKQLVKFLQTVGKSLVNKTGKQLRGQYRESFLVIQDQVVGEEEEELTRDCQRIRKDSKIKSIIEEAGYEIFTKSDLDILHKDMLPVRVWVLYPKY